MGCPIAGYRIDERGSRIVAGCVLALVALAATRPGPLERLVLLFLLADFGARAFSRPRWSLLARLSAQVLKVFGMAPRLVDAGAKRFAARVGLVFALALLVSGAVEARPAYLAAALVLSLCAALEAFVGFCLGCWMWTLWYGILDRVAGLVRGRGPR